MAATTAVAASAKSRERPQVAMSCASPDSTREVQLLTEELPSVVPELMSRRLMAPAEMAYTVLPLRAKKL